MDEEQPSSETSGEQMHTGTRLSNLRLERRLSTTKDWLLPLHDLKVEFYFHYLKMRETWKSDSVITMVVGCLAFLAGTLDLWSGELSGGGDVWRVGADGLNAVTWQAFAMVVLGLALWIAFVTRLLGQYPLMREKSFYMLVAWLAVEVGMINSHASTPTFPLGSSLVDFIWIGIGVAIIAFLSFNTWQAVIQTRDVHVEVQHHHPDPRVMDEAKRDHSLLGWTVVLGFWTVLVILNSWLGAHSVAFRDPSGLAPLRFLYFLTGVLIIIGLMHVLWYPQMMLGAAGEAIESDRAREVSRGLRGEENTLSKQEGKCPSCGADSPVSRLATGTIEIACQTDGCLGVGTPESRCPECSASFPSRVTCQSCGTSATLSDHLPDEEAW